MYPYPEVSMREQDGQAILKSFPLPALINISGFGSRPKYWVRLIQTYA